MAYDSAPPVPHGYPFRVVVTGLGAVTPIGNDVAGNWRALLARACGIKRLEREDLPENERAYFEQIERAASAGAIDKTSGALDMARWSDGGRYANFVAYARCAAHEAITDAGLDAAGEDVGVSFGAGMGGVHDLTTAGAMLREGVLKRKITPFFVPRILANAAAGRVSMDYGFRGPNLAASTACATSAHCIGEAFRAIQRGEAKAMIAGGAEGCIDAISFAAFAKARALSASGEAKPFDVARDGFVMGEGAGALVLESLEHARARGARTIYAEIRGYGASGDAYHVTRASPDGEGAARAMRAALRDAGVERVAQDVGYVNAHATGTALGDAAEAMALKAVFGTDAIETGYVATTSTKGATGHLLGAAGAIEAAYAILALHTGDIPPTVGYERMDDVLKIPLAHGRMRDDARAVLSNSFGFGGVNASLVFAKPPKL